MIAEPMNKYLCVINTQDLCKEVSDDGYAVVQYYVYQLYVNF